MLLHGERSFSKLKLIKTYLRNSLAQDKLYKLALLSIENNILKSLNTTEYKYFCKYENSKQIINKETIYKRSMY